MKCLSHITETGKTALFDDDNKLRCLLPGSGFSRTELPALEPRRKREFASTNNSVVVAAGSNRRIKRSVVPT
jgi:hypothetical protein